MGQVTIYLDEPTERTIRAAARAEGVSLSKWIARRIDANSRSEWPAFMHDLAGAWSDLPSADATRKSDLKDLPRRRLQRFEQFLSAIPTVAFDTAVARAAAQLRHTLERRGEGIGPLDTLIAATAIAHHATLVTRNVKEFGRIEGLTVSNWYA